jgi:hypothetical protein
VKGGLHHLELLADLADARPVRQQRIGFTQLGDDLFRCVMSSLHE